MSSVLAQVSKRILEKLEKGKKLSTEDILLLYMDMTYTELREIREELKEVEKRLATRIDETNKRIDSIHLELSRKLDNAYIELLKKIDETNKRIDDIHLGLSKKIDETNKRIDKLYELPAETRKEGK